MDKVTIKNISSAIIIISVPDIKFRRELTPGRVVHVDRETYDELTFDTGFNSLVEDHYIYVSGVDAEEVAAEAPADVFDYSEIDNILTKQDVTAFAKMIPTAKQAEKDTIVKLAVEKGITHPAFVKLIQQYCHVDVISAINRKHQVEE